MKLIFSSLAKKQSTHFLRHSINVEHVLLSFVAQLKWQFFNDNNITFVDKNHRFFAIANIA